MAAVKNYTIIVTLFTWDVYHEVQDLRLCMLKDSISLQRSAEISLQ